MSAARPKTVFLGLDATDLHLAQAFAADGSMPTLDHLLRSAAVVETVAPVGFFVGSELADDLHGYYRDAAPVHGGGTGGGGTYSIRGARSDRSTRRRCGSDSSDDGLSCRVDRRAARPRSPTELERRADRRVGLSRPPRGHAWSFPAGVGRTVIDAQVQARIRSALSPRAARALRTRATTSLGAGDTSHGGGERCAAGDECGHGIPCEARRIRTRPAGRRRLGSLLRGVRRRAIAPDTNSGTCTTRLIPRSMRPARARVGVDPLRAGLHRPRRDDRPAPRPSSHADNTAYVLLSHGMRAHYDGAHGPRSGAVAARARFASGYDRRVVVAAPAGITAARGPTRTPASPRSVPRRTSAVASPSACPSVTSAASMPWIERPAVVATRTTR